MTHYDYALIMDNVSDDSGARVFDSLAIVLERGDTAWNPVSTRYELFGPGKVVYRFEADGGVTAKVTK